MKTLTAARIADDKRRAGEPARRAEVRIADAKRRADGRAKRAKWALDKAKAECEARVLKREARAEAVAKTEAKNAARLSKVEPAPVEPEPVPELESATSPNPLAETSDSEQDFMD